MGCKFRFSLPQIKSLTSPLREVVPNPKELPMTVLLTSLQQPLLEPGLALESVATRLLSR